ncbi:IS21-like element helper ATPase IstB [Cetobacterium sp. ZWU0022]|uniref:IS21-like element helper ATPase IstB n=1 Tax=Cetobacterium sp. ZWU0022 TaxID=1340502 RepID=UPI0006454D4C|nr:IS21-like element helper ATPase IstB [Cetobacterium sp. ZWU0022]
MLNEELKELAIQLNLNNLRDNLDDYLLNAEQSNVSYCEFLKNVFKMEIEEREAKKYKMRLKKANLPYHKDFSDFDFNFQKSISKKKINILCEMQWVDRLFKLILLGPPGIGKTRIMISLGVEALKKGYDVFFVSMTDLIDILKYRKDSYKYNLLYKRVLNAQVLLLDEIGYLPISKEEANLFFQLISKLDEKMAMVITSNKTFSEWTEFLGDPALATAVLDRLSFRCEIFNLTGNSYRLEKREHLFNE